MNQRQERLLVAFVKYALAQENGGREDAIDASLELRNALESLERQYLVPIARRRRRQEELLRVDEERR